jgi:hypothetical protein
VPTGSGGETPVVGGPRDAVKEDVGWDRLSSHDDEPEAPGE